MSMVRAFLIKYRKRSYTGRKKSFADPFAGKMALCLNLKDDCVKIKTDFFKKRENGPVKDRF